MEDREMEGQRTEKDGRLVEGYFLQWKDTA